MPRRRRKLAVYITVWAVLAGVCLTCAPDEPQHPCDPESSIYNGCEKVAIGGACTIDPECEGDSVGCVDGVCVCFPQCTGKECGDDGCGGSCGECGAGWQCDGDQQCFDPCVGKECGDDGYGGSCGACGAEEVCTDYSCEYPETWTDSKSGLIWQVEPTGGTMKWDAAKTHCSDLDLAGHTDWRLPNIGELRSLIRGCPATEQGSATCKVEEGGCLDSTCNDGSLCKYCSSNGGPADGCYWPDEMQGACSWYWSSSPVEDIDDYAWYVFFSHGFVDDLVVYLDNYGVRCVR